MTYRVKTISLLAFLCLPVAAQACNFYPNYENAATFPSTISVPESLPVGGLIARAPLAGSIHNALIHCPAPILITTISRFSEVAPQPVTYFVFRTNVPGVGMVIRSTLRSGNVWFHPMRSGSATEPPGTRDFYQTSIFAEFYKIGPISTGTVPSGTLYDHFFNGRRVIQFRLNNSVRFVNPATTCDLAAGDVNRTIPLPTIKVSDLKDVVYAGTHNFDLTANCTSASNVTFRFTGTPAPGNNLLFANTGSAQGVALWLYSRIGGSAQTITTNATRTLAVSGNRAVLPLSAAYHKNGTVGQGTLVSTTTVNITYN